MKRTRSAQIWRSSRHMKPHIDRRTIETVLHVLVLDDGYNTHKSQSHFITRSISLARIVALGEAPRSWMRKNISNFFVRFFSVHFFGWLTGVCVSAERVSGRRKAITMRCERLMEKCTVDELDIAFSLHFSQASTASKCVPPKAKSWWCRYETRYVLYTCNDYVFSDSVSYFPRGALAMGLRTICTFANAPHHRCVYM